MATKLYNRQGGNLQGMDIRQPMSPDFTGAKIVGAIASETRKIADENYALGKSELITSIIDNAYNTAPDNLQKFDELVQDGLKKGVDGIPFKWQEEILREIKPKVEVQRAKVVINVNNRLDAERKAGVSEKFNALVPRMDDANTFQINAIINDDKENIELGQIYISQLRDNGAKLGSMKDMKGNYIIGDKATRDALATGQYNKVQIAKFELEKIGEEQLKHFYNNALQDRDRFMKAYGVDAKGYENIRSHTEKIIKQYDKEYEFKRRSQQEMNFAAMVNSSLYNEEELDTYEFISDDLKKKIKKARKKYEGKIYTSFADDSFLDAVSALQEVVEFNGSNEELLSKGVDVLEKISTIGQANGWDDATMAEMEHHLYNTLANQEFANAMKPLYADSRIRTVLTENSPDRYEMEERYKNLSVLERRELAQQAKFDNWQINESDKKGLKSLSRRVIAEAFALAEAGQYDLAQKRIADGNKELIKYSYGKIVPPYEWERLEKELETGKPAILMINGMPWEFQGYDSNDAIFKAKF